MNRFFPWIAIIVGASPCTASESVVSSGVPYQPPIYAQVCSFCHGMDGRGTDRGATLINPPHFQAMSDEDIAAIIEKGKGLMPAFTLPDSDIQSFVRYIRALNATGSSANVAGDPVVGERLFFGRGECHTCHVADGRGSSLGPNLSAVAGRLQISELEESLVAPDAAITPGYERVAVELNDGRTLHGFARARGSHDVVVQTDDGELHALVDSEYRSLTVERRSTMPAFAGSEEERRDLVAYLGQLDGIAVGPVAQPQPAVTPEAIDRVKYPREGEWPTYNGNLNGNRHSSLAQISRENISDLRLQWSFPIPFRGLETTPLVVGDVMYVTGNNQIFALSAKTGREIWRYERPKSDPRGLSSDARIGVNRGVALLGNRLFYSTDNAHLLALDRLTGALLWEVVTPDPEFPGRYGATGAPLVAGDLVIVGVGGADDGIRGFVAAYHAATGEEAWRFWTIPEYGSTGPIADTWQGTAVKTGGGSTWLTGSVDVETNILYKQVGNPFPDTDGDDRLGDNLYTNSDLALDLETGELQWHYQYTPHDVHDRDCNQPVVLIDTEWRGRERKLLLHANRNGFLYVLDRTNGQPLLAEQMVDKLTWASHIDPETWRPVLLPNSEVTVEGVLTAPAVRGATNWYSTAFNPETRLYYVMTVEDYTIYRKSRYGGFGRYVNPDDPAQKILRAFNIETGEVVWKIEMPGNPEDNYSGVLSTAGGVLFFGECSGGFAAADVRTGEYLWHFEAHAKPFKGSPMTYAIDGRQYVAVAAGSNILSFALPENK